MKKKGIGRWELALIMLALLVLAGFWRMQGRDGPGGTAYVTVSGEQVLELPLAQTTDQIIDLGVYGIPAFLEVKEHKLRFVNVTCPDHICEKTGWVWQDGQSAVCMPNLVSVVIVEES